MICGHTSQKSGRPLDLGHAICIDTWACGRGWLTCLDVYGGQVWQTNQQERVKRSRIEQFGPTEKREFEVRNSECPSVVASRTEL